MTPLEQAALKAASELESLAEQIDFWKANRNWPAEFIEVLDGIRAVQIKNKNMIEDAAPTNMVRYPGLDGEPQAPFLHVVPSEPA